MNVFSLIRDRTLGDSADVVLDANNPLYEKSNTPSRLKINGVEYTRKSEVHSTRGSRERRSKCFEFGEALIRSSDQKEVYYCYDCERGQKKQKMPVLCGTRGGRLHMEFHGRNPDSGELRPKQQRAAKSGFDLVERKSFDRFKWLLIRWFVVCQVAFFMIENVMFRELVAFLSPSIAALMPRASTTLRHWIVDEYETQKKKVVAELKQSHTKVHLSFDVWTAGNWFSIICVWGYWIDTSGNRQRKTLAFRRLYGSHSGENQAEALLDVINEYEITPKQLGVFVSDNHTANDAAVATVLKELYPHVTASEIKSRRFRCMGHILNLAATSLLGASDAEKANAMMSMDGDLRDLQMLAYGTFKDGPLGKLMRIIRYVLASSTRREEFGDLKGGRKADKFDHLGVSLSISLPSPVQVT